MKKLIALTLALVMVLSLAACGGNKPAEETPAPAEETAVPAEEEAPAEEAAMPELPDYLTDLDLPEVTTIEEGKLILDTNCAFPPYEMTADGEGFYDGYEGIDIEIAWYLAQTLGLELVIDNVDFPASLISVQEGKSDILLAGLTYTEERDKQMDFSTSYAKGVQVVIVPEDSDIASPDDLANDKMIGTQSGTTGYTYCSAAPEDGGFGEDHVLAYENGALAVQALMNGQVDAVVIDDAPAQEFVAANPGLKILETAYTDEDYCLAVDAGNTQLLEPLDTILQAMIKNGLVDEIVAKYINSGDEAAAE